MVAKRCESLKEIRDCIDALDESIVRLLVERGDYVVQAAGFKRDDSEVVAPERAAKVIENARRNAALAGGNAEVVARIYGEIVASFTDAELEVHRRK